jgi:hypothetical protein
MGVHLTVRVDSLRSDTPSVQVGGFHALHCRSRRASGIALGLPFPIAHLTQQVPVRSNLSLRAYISNG